MATTNTQSGTNIQEVADGIYRINTPVLLPGGGFSFNQYLILDEEPLLFHTGPRKMFPLVHEAVTAVLPPEKLRHIAFSHASPPWYRSRTWPTARLVRSRMASCCHSGNTPSVGLTHRTCRTRGNAVF